MYVKIFAAFYKSNSPARAIRRGAYGAFPLLTQLTLLKPGAPLIVCVMCLLMQAWLAHFLDDG